MPLSTLIAFGTVFGGAEGLRAAQAKSRREEHRSCKNNLIVHCPKSSEFSRLLEGRQVVLSGNKLYVDTGTVHDVPFGHPFSGYYLPYPDTKFAGLVSSITDEAPIMNWCYVDRQTYEWKFGTREHSEGNFTGPYDCTRQDRRLLFGGWEGFVAVKEGGFWALYFDRDDDRLASKAPPGTPVIEIELLRKELRRKKPPMPAPPPSAAAAAVAGKKEDVKAQEGKPGERHDKKKERREEMQQASQQQQEEKKELESEQQQSEKRDLEPLNESAQPTGQEKRPTSLPSLPVSLSPSAPTTPSTPASQQSAITNKSCLSATVEDASDEE